MPGTKPIWFTNPMPATLQHALNSVLGAAATADLQTEWPDHLKYRIRLIATGQTQSEAETAYAAMVATLKAANLESAEGLPIGITCDNPTPYVYFTPTIWAAKNEFEVYLSRASQGV